MKRFTIGRVVLATAVVCLSQAAVASAAGGNSANAMQCQKGGWMNLVRSDGTTFANQDACVSYAAKGGTLKPKPTCAAGSENFDFDADGSQPTTFSGGTINTAYGFTGSVDVQGGSWFGFFPYGTRVLFTGFNVNSFQLTFTQAVGSVSLDAEPSAENSPTTSTLTAYDASNNVVGSNSAVTFGSVKTLKVTSVSNNIDHFTIATDDPYNGGIAFTNITWSCN